MTGLLVTQKTRQSNDRWTPVIPGTIPVDWLRLLDDGRIRFVHNGENGEWDQEDPVLGYEVGHWAFRKPPGIGRPLVLIHSSGWFSRFKFDTSKRRWFFLTGTVKTPDTEYEDGDVDDEYPDEVDESDDDEAEVENECLVATPLFNRKHRKEYTENGINGLTFFTDGTFNYRNETFGKHQEIDHLDKQTQTKIRRACGRGKMLTIYEPSFDCTYRFTFHTAIEHPFIGRWYRWSTRPIPRLRDRWTSKWQAIERKSFLFRMTMWALISVVGIALGIVMVCCPLLWPLIPYLQNDE